MTVEWIYLSPHFDDVALSCGGLVWEQAQAGRQVSIWTICAGDPPPGLLSPFARSLHDRWAVGSAAIDHRRAEDRRSCARLGAAYRHFPIPDCVYRSAGELLYITEESLFGPLHPAEAGLVQALSADLAQTLPQEAQVVCPLALGGHVDHRLTRAAFELLGRPGWYYADYPYVSDHPEEISGLEQAGWEAVAFPVSAQGLEAWQGAVAAHTSQISTFWPDVDAMRASLSAYRHSEGGVRLWKPPAGGTRPGTSGTERQETGNEQVF